MNNLSIASLAALLISTTLTTVAQASTYCDGIPSINVESMENKVNPGMDVLSVGLTNLGNTANHSILYSGRMIMQPYILDGEKIYQGTIMMKSVKVTLTDNCTRDNVNGRFNPETNNLWFNAVLDNNPKYNAMFDCQLTGSVNNGDANDSLTFTCK